MHTINNNDLQILSILKYIADDNRSKTNSVDAYEWSLIKLNEIKRILNLISIQTPSVDFNNEFVKNISKNFKIKLNEVQQKDIENTKLINDIIHELIEMYIFSKSDEDEYKFGQLIEKYIKLNNLNISIEWED